MKQIFALAIALMLWVSPIYAEAGTQDPESPEPEGFSLMEEGAKALLRGLLQEIEPALEDLEGFATEMGPAMEELRAIIGDFSAYHLPEVLPNGDIIIRRKIPLVPEVAPEIEL